MLARGIPPREAISGLSFLIFQNRLQRLFFEPRALAGRACEHLQIAVRFCDQRLLAMRAYHRAQSFAQLLDQLRVVLARPLVLARGLDVVHLFSEPILIVVCHSVVPAVRGVTHLCGLLFGDTHFDNAPAFFCSLNSGSGRSPNLPQGASRSLVHGKCHFAQFLLINRLGPADRDPAQSCTRRERIRSLYSLI